jgi:hypothetical protein
LNRQGRQGRQDQKIKDPFAHGWQKIKDPFAHGWQVAVTLNVLSASQCSALPPIYPICTHSDF